AALPPRLVLGAPRPRVDDQLVVGVVERPGRALQQLGGEGLQVGDDDPDEVGPPAAHAAGDEARLVAEVGDHRLDLGDGVGSDAVTAVEHPGHGGDRHPRLSSDVLDGHPVGRRLLRGVSGSTHGPTLSIPLSIPLSISFSTTFTNMPCRFAARRPDRDFFFYAALVRAARWAERPPTAIARAASRTTWGVGAGEPLTTAVTTTARAMPMAAVAPWKKWEKRARRPANHPAMANPASVPKVVAAPAAPATPSEKRTNHSASEATARPSTPTPTPNRTALTRIEPNTETSGSGVSTVSDWPARAARGHVCASVAAVGGCRSSRGRP